MQSKTKMDSNPKLAKLYSLDEKALRENLLVPLLTRMGLKAAAVYHGPRERGKDIVCFDVDRLGNREYIGVVAKTTALDGSVSSTNSLREVLCQIEQCFNVPYEDLFGMTRVSMNRVWVVTSQKIVSGAADSIFDQLAKTNLSKLVKFIGGETLLSLIDQHYPAYWDQSLEPVDVLMEQKHRLESFTRRLLLSLGGDNSGVEATINQVIHSAFPPEVQVPPDRSLTRVSPYAVEVDSISEEYSHDFWSDQCGFIKTTFLKAKKDAYYAMFDVEEIMEHYERFIKKTNLHDIVNEFSSVLSKEYPFWRSSFDSAADAGQEIEYLRCGLIDIDSLRERLKSIAKLDWATALVDSVDLLKDEISSFLSHVDKEEFVLCWRIDTVQGKGQLRLEYDDRPTGMGLGFSTMHKKNDTFYTSGRGETRRITVEDVVYEVQSKLRERFEALLAERGLGKKDQE